MKGLHRPLMGRVLSALAVFAVIAGTTPSVAQVVWPPRADIQVQSIAFTTTGVTLLGTAGFGMYRDDPTIGTAVKWFEANGDSLALPISINDIDILADGNILIATSSRPGFTGLYESTDGGMTWMPVRDFQEPDSSGIAIINAMTQSPVDSTLYISANDGVMFQRTLAVGEFQKLGRLPEGSSDTPQSLIAHPSTAQLLYAGTFGRGTYVSTTGGATWSITDTDSTLIKEGAGYIYDLEWAPGTTTLFAGTSKGVWNSADGGDTWAPVDTAMVTLGGVERAPEVRHIAFDASGTLYAATWGFGVHTNPTPTGGGTFSEFALKNAEVEMVAINPITGEVVAITSDGKVHSVGQSSVVNVVDADVPTDFVLEQNYPNPFNPSTEIRFTIPATDQVRLAVYDMLGREVALLVDGVVQAGSHQVTFDASNLASGLYLYKLEAASLIQSRSMTLLR